MNATLAGAAPAHTTRVEGLQHTGAVHFYAQPGILEVTIWNRNAANAPEDRTFTSTLVGPDGEVHDRLQLISPEKQGEAGPLQEGSLKAQVERAGIYTLLLSPKVQDPYQSTQTWGFSTNATQYMLNSATGHNDRGRFETISLRGGDNPFGIFFKPVQRTFKIEFTRLPATTQTIELRDASGRVLRTLTAAEGKAETTIAEGEGARDGVWELRLPSQRGDVLIEGLNHGWTREERPLPVWTTSRASYFEVADHHWLLQPRRFARRTQAGTSGTVEMTVFNNSNAPMPLELSADVPATLGAVRVVPQNLEIAPGASARVSWSTHCLKHCLMAIMISM